VISSKRIDGLDFLRGIASLAVCWFHLTSYHFPTSDGWAYSAIRSSGSYGWLGVEVFFVISGFVIPYSLHRAGYDLSGYTKFVWKRIVRLDPPYLVTLVLLLALAYAFAIYTGRPVEVEGAPITLTRLLLHLGYLNMFFGYEWLNPSFWTLAIEFQYYLMMGLLFPLLNSRNRIVRWASIAAFAVPALFTSHRIITGGVPISSFIFHFAFLFVMGIVTFHWWAKLIGRNEYLIGLIAATAGAFFSVGLIPTLAGIFAVLIINFYNQRTIISEFFGNISYSLYLLHWPLGHLTLSIVGARVLGANNDLSKVLTLFIALVVCFISSYVLFRFVERPAQQWSSRISYGRGSRTRNVPQEVSGLTPSTG
jgi:peptidoglycan/LPS O-acetylase OafA/YrhL